MENASPQAVAGASPPPPPNPDADAQAGSINDYDYDGPTTHKTDDPIVCQSEDWDIHSVSSLAALRMLINALTALSNQTGDVPPTPPVTRPSTPKTEPAQNPFFSNLSPRPNPNYPLITSPSTPTITTTPTPDSCPNPQIARRFFSRTPPSFTLSAYLHRLHTYCPHSPAVYLAAAVHLRALCLPNTTHPSPLVPPTPRTIHRLALAAIRISAKTLEDYKWEQAFFARVGGVGGEQLLRLEVGVCFLLGFELAVGVAGNGLGSGVWGLQRAVGGKGVGDLWR
ncbi:hypothetical protein MBLNU230_g0979t1 [Neophaeotheca triangularis]